MDRVITNGGMFHITNNGGDGWGIEGDGEGGITFGPPDHHGTFNIGGDGLVYGGIPPFGGDGIYIWPPGIDGGGLGAITNEGDIPIITNGGAGLFIGGVGII